MDSATSAAASMLASGSSTSQPAGHSSSPCFGNVPTQLNDLKFSHFDQSRAQEAFMLNHASPLFSTISLDLTSASPSSSNHVNQLPSCFASSPGFPLATFWSDGFPNNGTMPMGNQFQELIHQQYMKNQTPSREALVEILTKAMSTDLCLRSVIATVVSSIVGGGEISCSHYLNRLSSSSSQTGHYMLLPPPLSFSVAKRITPPSIIDQVKYQNFAKLWIRY